MDSPGRVVASSGASGIKWNFRAANRRANMQSVDTIVVGAGIAGLTAACALHRQGIEVVVLEASNIVGGRMATLERDGFLIDTGAQFLSSGYRIVPRLARACGLVVETTACSTSAIVVDQRLRRIRSGSVLDPFTSGLLGPIDWIRLGMLFGRNREALQRKDLSDFSQWADHDVEDTAGWVTREAGTEALERVFEPMLEGLYFQQPETTSRALSLMMSGFGWRKHRPETLRGGMGSLPRALATSLDVRLGVKVSALREQGAAVEVTASQTSYRARRVICAVPAPQARQVWQTAPDTERALMATPYSSTINLALMMKPGYELPRELQDVYGVLVPRRERGLIAALGIEKNKCVDRAPSAHLINVMLSDAAANAEWAQTDDGLLSKLEAELVRYLPGFRLALERAVSFRWPHAEPRSPVGRATYLMRYRSHKGPARRILLAGDYMGAPFTEGAAESGEWVARQST